MNRKINGASQRKSNQGLTVGSIINILIFFAAPVIWRTFAARLK